MWENWTQDSPNVGTLHNDDSILVSILVPGKLPNMGRAPIWIPITLVLIMGTPQSGTLNP